MGHPICSLLIALVALISLFGTAPAVAQQKVCECQFRQKPWYAYGSIPGCSALMKTGRTECIIGFGGLGAQGTLIEKVLGTPQNEYKSRSYKLFHNYLNAIEKNDKKTLTDSKFIRATMPLFMRGVLLRGNVTDQNIKNINELDGNISIFFKQYSNEVSKVFKRQVDFFVKIVNVTKFRVEYGAVIVDHKDTHLMTVFF